jgi:hypothetical protein
MFLDSDLLQLRQVIVVVQIAFTQELRIFKQLQVFYFLVLQLALRELLGFTSGLKLAVVGEFVKDRLVKVLLHWDVKSFYTFHSVELLLLFCAVLQLK